MQMRIARQPKYGFGSVVIFSVEANLSPPRSKVRITTGSGAIRLAIDTFGLQDSEFVYNWFFNLDPDLDAEFLSFVFQGGSGLPATVSLGNDDQNAGGERGQGFDIELRWSTSQGSRFIADKFIFWDITYSDPGNPLDTISASSFDLVNQGELLSAANVQGIDIAGQPTGSGWIAAVPIPGSVWLLASGVLGFLILCKRSRD